MNARYTICCNGNHSPAPPGLTWATLPRAPRSLSCCGSPVSSSQNLPELLSFLGTLARDGGWGGGVPGFQAILRGFRSLRYFSAVPEMLRAPSATATPPSSGLGPFLRTFPWSLCSFRDARQAVAGSVRLLTRLFRDPHPRRAGFPGEGSLAAASPSSVNSAPEKPPPS